MNDEAKVRERAAGWESVLSRIPTPQDGYVAGWQAATREAEAEHKRLTDLLQEWIGYANYRADVISTQYNLLAESDGLLWKAAALLSPGSNWQKAYAAYLEKRKGE